MTHIFNTRPGKRARQEVEPKLRTQLRKNPHRFERPTRPKVCARTGVRTNGFFCGRLKRLASRSRRSSVCRGVFGRRRRESDQYNRTMAATNNAAIDPQSNSQIDHQQPSRIAMMRCPADGADIDEDSQDGIHVECPRCRSRWRIDKTVVVSHV